MKALTDEQLARAKKEVVALVMALNLVLYDYVEKGNLDTHAAITAANVMKRIEGQKAQSTTG